MNKNIHPLEDHFSSFDNKEKKDSKKHYRNNEHKRTNINIKKSHTRIPYENNNQSSNSSEHCNNIHRSDNKKKSKKPIIIIVISIIILLLIAVSIVLYIVLKSRIKEGTIPDSSEVSDNIQDEEENEEDIIIQNLEINKKSTGYILVEGINQTIDFKNNNTYEIYTYRVNNTPGEKNGINYFNKTTYAIPLKNKNCLSCKEEEDEDFCLIEIYDGNNFLSIKCPQSFDEKDKIQIVSDSKYFNYNKNNSFIERKNKQSSDTNGYNIEKTIKITVKKKEIEKNKKDYDEKISKAHSYKEEYSIKPGENPNEGDDNDNDSDNNKDNNNNINDNNNDIGNDIVLFNRTISDFYIKLNNRIEFFNDIFKAYLILKINGLQYQFPYVSEKIKLNEIKNHYFKIKTLNNASNELIQNIKKDMDTIIENITQNFKNLIPHIKTENFTHNFESIGKSKIKSQKYIDTLNLAKNNLEKHSQKVPDIINNYSEIANQNINKYISKSIELMNNISDNIISLNDSLNSQVNIYTKIANYYLNNTSFSYDDIIKKANNIFNNYYKYDSELINAKKLSVLNEFEKGFENLNLENDFNKFQNNFNFEDENDIKAVKDYIQILNNQIQNIIIRVKEEFQNKINEKDNGFYISNEDIINNSNKYNKSLDQTLNVISNLNNLDIIDKTFDNLMLSFQDNFTEFFKFLEDEKNNKFPLEENILKDFYSPIEEQIKNEIDNINNQIKENNNLYIHNINKIIEDFLINNKSELNSYINDINILCSNEFLEELFLSFKKASNNYLNLMKNNLKYLEDKILEKTKDDNISLKKLNQKLRISIKNIKKYIKKDLITDLSVEYNKILIKIINIPQIIRIFELDEKYKEINDLSFINEHIKRVNESVEKINNFFLFENKYKNELNKSIEELNIDSNIESIPVTNRCNECQLYIKLKSGKTDCINIFDSSNEDINLILYTIENDSGLQQFKNKFDKYYSLLTTSINSYYSIIEKLNSSLSKAYEELNNQNFILDFSSFNNKINSLLSEKFGTELIKKSYEYYKDKTNFNIEEILNESLIILNNTFNNLANEIVDNNKKFKTSLSEFGIISLIYENIITQNITRNYFDLLIDNQKNNFNYSISYYYNYFLNLINSAHKNIINNLPINKYGLNTIIDEYKKIIDTKFNEFIIKINNSKKDSLNIDRQVYTLTVPRTNFFKANGILSNNVLLSRNLLEEKRNEIMGLDNDKTNTEEILHAKLYLENSNNAKQIEDLYKLFYNGNEFLVLDQENFKVLIKDNFGFDKNDFIKQLNILLYNISIENDEQFSNIKTKCYELFENELNNYFSNENKGGISDIINNLYNNKFKFSENDIKQIKENIKEILDKIISHLNDETNKIKQQNIYYNFDYSKIEEKLNEYKKEIINGIKTEINKIVNDYRGEMINIIYNNKVEIDLNNYMQKINEITQNYNEEKKLLNSSYNIGKTIENIIEFLINKYKEITKKLINYKNQTKLIDIINIEEIKTLINNKIDNGYNKTLYSKNSSDIIYNFSSSINDDIKSTINSKLNNIKIIISTFYSNNQNILNNYILPSLDLSRINEKVSNINQTFNEFIASSAHNDNKQLNEFLKNITITSFNISLNNTISLFGNIYFERYMKYNELFKIAPFKNNIKYSIVQLLLYYQFLYEFKNKNHKLCNDLIDKMHKMNNIDKTIQIKKNELLRKLEDKKDNFINITRDEIIQNYISELKNDSYLNSFFNFDININNQDFEKVYNDILNNNLKENINNQYSKILNTHMDEIKELAESQKNEMKNKIPKNTQDNNEELIKINNLLDKTSELIDNFYNKSFNMSEDIVNYYNSQIKSIFDNLTELYNNSKKNLFKAVDDNIKSPNSQDIINEFKSNLNQIFLDLLYNLNKILGFINNFKNSENIRILDDNLINNEDHSEENNGKIDSNFATIIKTSNINKKFVNNFEYNRDLIKCINNFNQSFKNAKESFEEYNFGEEIKEYILDKLSVLNKTYLNYYTSINESLFNIYNKSNHLINQINDSLTNASEKVKKKIYDLKEEMNNKLDQKELKSNEIDSNQNEYTELFMIKTAIKDNKNNSFNINLNFDDIDNYTIYANLKNQIKLDNFIIKIIQETGNYIIDLNLDFNDKNKITYTSDFYNINSNETQNLKNIEFEQEVNEDIITSLNE